MFFIDGRVMQCHAIIDVRVMFCDQAMDNSGFSTSLNFLLRVQFLILYQFIITFPCSHFVHIFAPGNASFEVWCLQKADMPSDHFWTLNQDGIVYPEMLLSPVSNRVRVASREEQTCS